MEGIKDHNFESVFAKTELIFSPGSFLPTPDILGPPYMIMAIV
jgi:hypothetical protein